MNAPGQAPPDDGGKKKRILIGVLGGCFLFFGMCCVCPVAGFVGGNAKAKSEAEDAVNAWLTDIRSGRYDAAYASMDSWYRSRKSRDEFVEDLMSCGSLRTHTTATVDEVTVDHPFDDFVLVRVSISGGEAVGMESLSLGLERDEGWKIGTFTNFDDHGCRL
ncbi:MAG: hypothetical protein R3B82_00320 [Sandaracinaceae bacterium]